MTAQTELQTVSKELDRLRSKQMKLEADVFKEKILPELQGSIGRTSVYRNNSRGSGGKWDTYRKIIAVSFSEYHAWLIFEECAVDCDGKATLQTEAELIHRSGPYRTANAFPHLELGWKECPPEEYAAARAATLAELERPAAFLKYLEDK